MNWHRLGLSGCLERRARVIEWNHVAHVGRNIMPKRSIWMAFAIAIVLAASVSSIGATRPHSTDINAGVVDPTCTSSLPCIEYDNNGTGQGVKSVSSLGNGLTGWTSFRSTSATNFKSGVVGNDQSGSGLYDAGVYGKSVRGTGVLGNSTSGFGVVGNSTSIGVFGTSNGTSAGSAGVEGSGTTVGVSGGSNFGIGVSGFSVNIAGEFDGDGIGVIARSSGGTTNYPLILRDQNNNDVFFVNGNGDVFYHGSLNTFALVAGGNVATAFTSKSTSPMVEDTGSGRLINGTALVSLDPAFAQTIDRGTPYHVLLTPDGDTRGLYVERKTPTAFVVREVQNGRGSLVFDYHIYAPARGHIGERMIIMTPSATRTLMPHVNPTLPLRGMTSQVMPPRSHPRPV